MRLSKKNQLAAGLSTVGILRLLEAAPRRPQLLVLNYHRIGEANEAPFDPGVFSTNAKGFEEQICVLKSRYQFATPVEALEIIEQRVPMSEMKILLTFDDGYRDNFVDAFPVLQRHNLEAIFFLPTSALEREEIPWWDAIAFFAKRHAPNVLNIHYPVSRQFDLSEEQFERSLRSLLNLFKSPETADAQRFINELKVAVNFAGEVPNDQLMMSWSEARMMQAAGMTIGLHTHSHRILSKISFSEQVEELTKCRARIEAELGTEATMLSYPVGTRDSFNDDTIAAAKKAGMRAGFSFYGGSNLPGDVDPFNVRRVAFESYAPISRVRLSTGLIAVTGSKWI